VGPRTLKKRKGTQEKKWTGRIKRREGNKERKWCRKPRRRTNRRI
jgi:hypothetical protein